jgi:phosphonate ABC transporter permease subunit PhnE
MQAPAPSRASAALRRTLLLIVAAVVLVIFAYGWTVTDIDLSVPQEPVRQQNVGNALRELLSPNVFTQDYDVQGTTAPFLVDCTDDFAAPPPAFSETAYIVVFPACASSGEMVRVEGYNFLPNTLARINWIALDGERRARAIAGGDGDNFVTDDDGTFEVQIEVPRIRGTSGETHTIEALERIAVGAPRLSETTGLVVEKMIETIFLALIATAVSILPSAILSFFAAHNLMRPIRLPLGNLLIMLVLLPVGWLVGTLLLARIGEAALSLTSGGAAAASLGLLVFGIASVAAAQGFNRTPPPTPNPMRGIGGLLLAIVVFIIGLGLLGGLGLLLEQVATTGILRYLGAMFGSLGELTQLLLPTIAGVLGAFAISSIGTTLTRSALKSVSIPISHLVGAVLGGIAGAIFLGIIANIGMIAAWLGLLTPVLAGALAAPILPMIYRRLVQPPKPPRAGDRLAMTLLGWLGAGIAVVITFSALNVGRSVVEGVLPPAVAVERLSFGGFTIYEYTLTAMLIGAVLGALAAGIAGTRANFPIGDALYTTTRTILNALRSIEPLIMGLVFVIWVGIGPFAGVLALALHSVASLGKLYSEQVENIDLGPIEALQSTGANQLQTIMFAVVPQIIPPYIAFTMYRWDINVRMSTIIGFVGGGGIGFLLQQQINLLRYRDAGVAVLAIAIVVSILDYASAAIRERYT